MPTTTPRKSAAKARKAGGAKATATTISPINLKAALEKLKLPGVDIQTLIDARRKDIEALLDANDKAHQAFEAMSRRQTEILAEAMKDFNEGARDLLNAPSAAERATMTATQAQQAFGSALSNMRELAEMAAESNKEVLAVLNRRLQTGLQEIRGQITGKK